MSARKDWLEPIVVALAATAMCAIAAALVAAASAPERAAAATCARVLMIATPIVAGLIARRTATFERFGGLLIAAGAGWFLTTLSMSHDEVVHSAGRVAGWCFDLGLIYLLLAFPRGRLETRADRWLIAAGALLLVTLYLPTALVIERFPTPSPYDTCGSGCAANAFMLLGSEPAIVGDLIQPLRELLTVALFTATMFRLQRHLRAASHLERRLRLPVVAVGMFRLLALIAALASRAVAPAAGFTEVLAWAVALALPALALAFLYSVVRWRYFIAAGTSLLAARVRARSGLGELREALAEAFDDPQLDVAYRIGHNGRWADAAGRPVDLWHPPPGRVVTQVLDGDRAVAALVHDPALGADRGFVENARSYALLTLHNTRLTQQAALLVEEVQESRARIQAAADEERRRIEHDLHDGAQQRLVALRIKLELAAERADESGDESGLLRRAGKEIEEALDEVRSLARGIYPAPLAARGLVEALQSAALRSALPTVVIADGVGRYTRDVEAAAYFCCLEAMQNAAKHARGASTIVIELSFNGALRFEISDDGAGFDVARMAGGVGLTSMSDRLLAVGGKLSIDSAPEHGTQISATIPIDDGAVVARV